MQLRTLLPLFSPLNVEGALSTEVSGLAYEARRVSPGDIYFALRRNGVDGHAEIELAVARGAVAVVCERKRCLRLRAAVIEVEDPRVALGNVAAQFYGKPGDKLRVIGVTGRNGTWKTAYLLQALLRHAGVPTGLISTLRHEIGQRRLPVSGPVESSDIHRLFSEMLRAGIRTCVLELPEISAAALRSIPLDVLVMGGGDAQYWAGLFDYLKNTAERRPTSGVLNADAAVGREAACGVQFDALVSYGYSSAAQVSAQDVRFSTESVDGSLYIGNDSFPFELPLVGADNLAALLGACAAAFTCDLDSRQIADALHGIDRIPGSLEPVHGGRGFTVFVDDAHTEAALEGMLRCVRSLTRGRILLAFGANERTTGRERFAMARVVARFAEYVILTSDNPGREGVAQICSALAQGLEAAGHTQYHFQPNRTDAIAELIGLAQPGDVVIITGKGERAYQEYASTIVPFDDRIVAAERLSAFVAAPPRPHAERRTLVPV